ncbi:MAG: CNNM domain-containing protein [Coxiellaceae bacterium]|nr:CNNM domain-containing protein [Coxiellaceae bacterium]
MLITVLILLIFFAAFFSMAETGMMAVNRYRLRHLSRKSHKRAQRVLKLLERPDRLLGVILLGSTCCNIGASAIATIVATRLFGEVGVLVEAVVLTFVILVFAETAPKTLAAISSQSTALRVSLPLMVLLKILYPFVWLVNIISNNFLRLFGVHVDKNVVETLTIDELRSIVHEATGRPSHYQDMLLHVLDLQQITAEEVMVPKGDIEGVDIEQPWSDIVAQLLQFPHAYVPLYREHIDQIQGVLSLRSALVFLAKGYQTLPGLLQLAKEPYFIPEGVLLHQQVLNFQREKTTIGFVVDEYAGIQGLLTLRDVLEEVVGDFSTGALGMEALISTEKDDSMSVDASISVRDLNRLVGWHFPLNGSRTLSGLIIEHLESIPENAVCVRIAGYPMEVVSVSQNTIEKVRVYPKLWVHID